MKGRDSDDEGVFLAVALGCPGAPRRALTVPASPETVLPGLPVNGVDSLSHPSVESLILFVLAHPQ